MTPNDLFKQLKDSINTINDKQLIAFRDNALRLGSKYARTGQIMGARKILFLAKVLEKEKKLIKLGVNKFIYKDTILDYVDNPDNRTTEEGQNRVVKLIELRNYSREIPDSIVDIVEKTKDIFSDFLVLYTDYTDKENRRRKADQKYTDPILFGIFIDDKNTTCADRFYVLGDWEDEYCDLTLDKLIAETGEDITKPVLEPAKSMEELKAYIESYVSKNNGTISFAMNEVPIIQKKTFFQKIRSFLKW